MARSISTGYSNDTYRTWQGSIRGRSAHFPSSNEAVPDWNLAQDGLATSTGRLDSRKEKGPGVSPRPSFAITSSLTAARETAPREVALDISAEANASFFSLQASWRPSSVWPWLSWPRLFSPELFWRPLVRAWAPAFSLWPRAWGPPGVLASPGLLPAP